MATPLVERIQDALRAGKTLSYVSDRNLPGQVLQVKEGMIGGKRPIVEIVIRNTRSQYTDTYRYHPESSILARIAAKVFDEDPPAQPSPQELQAEIALSHALSQGRIHGVIANRAIEPYIRYDEDIQQAKIVWYSYLPSPEHQYGIYTLVDATNNDTLSHYVFLLMESVRLVPSHYGPEDLQYHLFDCPHVFKQLATFPDDGSLSIDKAFEQYGPGTLVSLRACGCEFRLSREDGPRIWGNRTKPCDRCKDLSGVYRWCIWCEQVEVIDKR